VRYRLYGLTLASDFPFASRLFPGSGPPEVTCACSPGPADPGPPPDGEAISESPDRHACGETLARLYRLPSAALLRFTGAADFALQEDRIDCRLHDPASAALAEIRLLGTVFAFYLERRGVPALHAAAVAVGGRAAAFLSTNQGGKTSLAASLLQAGGSLLTDDLLPLEVQGSAFLARSGYPQMRMWPDAAECFLGTTAGLERVLPGMDKRRVPVGAGSLGRFCAAPQPLAAVYLPKRAASPRPEIRISPVAPRDAVIELVRHSYCPGLAAAVGLEAERLAFFARLAATVPVRRLSYPSGFDQLERVRAAVLDDLANR
jgi:hypothetical protein